MTEKSHLNYKPSIKQFCNKELRDNRFLSEEKEKEYRIRFTHCVDLVKTVFGKNALRRYIPIKDSTEHGYWATTRINMALFDIQMCCFAIYSKNDILRNADFIREAMIELMSTNQEFIDSIEINTSNKEVLKKRFQLWLNKLDEILDISYAPRTFPFSIKQMLFESNPRCAISGQQILAIEDAEVDHIIPFSQGGKTEIDNAQLVLRYFNRAKGAKGFASHST